MSMTGFGRATAEAEGKRITVEIKSFNSKQLDLNVRIPNMLREYEIDMRQRLLREIERGKVDLTVTIEAISGADASVRLNMPALTAYRDQIRRAAAELGIPEVWDMIDRYFAYVTANGYFEERRRLQAKYWMRETIDEQLRNHFYRNPEIEVLLSALEREVLANRLSSFTAAGSVLDAYFSHFKNHGE